MEFTFDQSQLPVIGSHLMQLSPEPSALEPEASVSERHLEAPSSGSVVADNSPGFGWKRPLQSQVFHV